MNTLHISSEGQGRISKRGALRCCLLRAWTQRIGWLRSDTRPLGGVRAFYRYDDAEMVKFVGLLKFISGYLRQ